MKRYLISIVSVGLAFLITVELNRLVSPPLPFAFFFLSVVISAWYGGFGPGLLATILGLVIARYYSFPLAAGLRLQAEDLLKLTVFAVISLFVTLLAEARRRSEERLRVSLSSIADGVVTVDSAGRILFMNESAQKMTGWKLTEVRKKAFDQIFKLVDERDHSAVELNANTKKTRRRHSILLETRDARFVPIEESIAPVIGAGEQTEGVIIVLRDISTRKQVEKEKEASRERAQFLADAIETVSKALNYRVALSALGRMTVPYLADWCIIWSSPAPAQLEQVANHRNDALQRTSGEYESSTFGFVEQGAVRMLNSSQSVLYTGIGGHPPESEEQTQLIDALRQLGARSFMMLPLYARRRTMGIMLLALTGDRQYTPADLIFAMDLASRAAVLIDNTKLFENLHLALKDKELLLREVHHRVKNNLQVISSLLNLQSRALPSHDLKIIFNDTVGRVKAMAQLHQMLYASDELAYIDFAQYAQRLGDELIRSYKLEDRVVLKVKSQPCSLEISTGVSLGLILNEIISNSLKNAFPGERRGSIFLSIICKDDAVKIRIGDNGLVMVGAALGGETFGMQLIHLMVDQIGASLYTLQDEHGKFFDIQFSKSRAA